MIVREEMAKQQKGRSLTAEAVQTCIDAASACFCEQLKEEREYLTQLIRTEIDASQMAVDLPSDMEELIQKKIDEYVEDTDGGIQSHLTNLADVLRVEFGAAVRTSKQYTDECIASTTSAVNNLKQQYDLLRTSLNAHKKSVDDSIKTSRDTRRSSASLKGRIPHRLPMHQKRNASAARTTRKRPAKLTWKCTRKLKI